MEKAADWLSQLAPNGLLLKNRYLLLCPYDEKACYAMASGGLYSSYKLFCWYPGVLSVLFWLYPVHLTLSDFKRTDTHGGDAASARDTLSNIDRESKTMIVWLCVTCVESLRFVVGGYPLIRMCLYGGSLYLAYTTSLVDNKVLHFCMDQHDRLLRFNFKELMPAQKGE